MKYREFGVTGMKVSVVGMGTYFDPIWIALAMLFRYQSRRKRILEALKIGLEGGINFVDTDTLFPPSAWKVIKRLPFGRDCFLSLAE